MCTNRSLEPGVNDLGTVDPELAKEADGWDPTQVLAGTHDKKKWRCELGHSWTAEVKSRRPPDSRGCPYCSGNKVLAGFNDLATKIPELAKEADGWDPQTVTTCSNRKVKWKCSKCSNKWQTQVNARTPPHNTGCPECAESGFKKELPAWFYLLERPGEQQLGVTNFKENRLKTHAKNGWEEVEVLGPAEGSLVLETEKRFKQWLKAEVGVVPGTSENWFTAKLEVRSLAELKAKSGVETELLKFRVHLPANNKRAA